MELVAPDSISLAARVSRVVGGSRGASVREKRLPQGCRGQKFGVNRLGFQAKNIKAAEESSVPNGDSDGHPPSEAGRCFKTQGGRGRG